jgi:enoyl-CoA hydratase
MYNNLLVENQNGILIITINREDKLNALNIELLSELKKVVKIVYDDKTIKGAILTGKGPKAFAAGADIAEFASFTEKQGIELSQSGGAIFKSIEECPKPFLALNNGFTLGGGCELAMACHMRIATDNAKFGQPEVALGIIPGYGATQRLVQLVGKGKALELLMTGNMITAAEAKDLGLVNYTFASIEEAMDKCKELINKIATQGPLAIAKIIDCVNCYFDHNIDGFEEESKLFGASMNTQDFKEGTTAFIEKRKAVFTGQ